MMKTAILTAVAITACLTAGVHAADEYRSGSCGYAIRPMHNGTPVVYHLVSGDAWTRVTWSDGRDTQGRERLGPAASAALFARRGEIERIDVGVPAESLLVEPQEEHAATSS